MVFQLPDKPSIAVLPLPTSVVTQGDYFGDGIAEEIITALSKTPKLFVIARIQHLSIRESRFPSKRSQRDWVYSMCWREVSVKQATR